VLVSVWLLIRDTLHRGEWVWGGLLATRREGGQIGHVQGEPSMHNSFTEWDELILCEKTDNQMDPPPFRARSRIE
ncbi:MAG: hypothetical protein ABEI52_11325, partial [Halobacteriaceae archaeon]